MTGLGIMLTLTTCVIAAIALDVARLRAAQSQLQIMADAAAHAALYYRDTHSAAEAKEMALDVVGYGMPADVYGDVLRPEDITFGTWSYELQAFRPSDTSRDAVLVTTERIAENQNGITPYLFGFVGRDTFDVATNSVFTTYRPTCFREGFVAEEVVDIQSNNNYYNGFCIHANGHVELNSNNVFEAGTIVSMPDTGDIVLPQSGFETNEGLEAALRSGVYRLRIINRLPAIIQNFIDEQDTFLPDYITTTTAVDLSGKTLTEADFQTGRLHRAMGANNCKLTLSPSVPLERIVLVTNCEVKFSQGTQLHDVVIATTNTGAKSMNAPSTLQVGRDDHCAEGGGAQMLSLGGMEFASDLRMYGGQLVAKSNIEFSANADGIEGASMISGTRIDGTSNMNMGFCVTGMEDNYEAAYFRMAQ
ncbi:hypothetical protein DYI42_10515 [Vannielia litorea]|nr:hypothetical protein [Vannielia litorea]